MRTKLQILGSGCAKCELLAEHAARAAHNLGLEYELEKVTAIDEILAFGLVATPALVVDGEVKAAGHVLSTPRIEEILASRRSRG